MNRKRGDKMEQWEKTKESIFSKIKQKPIKIEDLYQWAEKNSMDKEQTREHIQTLKNEWKIVEEKEDVQHIHENGKFRIGQIKLNTNGFGFVQIKSEQRHHEEKEVYIDKNDLKQALDGDEVLIKIKKSKKGFSEEGQVFAVIKRKLTEIVGTFIKSGTSTLVIPDGKNKENPIQVEDKNGLVTGHKVIVKINEESKEEMLKGEIVQVIGHKNDPGVDILSVVLKHGIEPEFPKEVLLEVEQIENGISEGERKKRKDFRHECIITIDGSDAKDLDDAVQVKKLDNGHYYLGVHIADVSHYVREDQPLDAEALKRSTSVYLVDRVIPMLPHKLSNDLCSLNPYEEKLTLSCEMEIDCNGEVKKYNISESIIKTKYRMTYDDVNEIIEQKNQLLHEQYKEIVPMILDMNELSHILIKKRKNQGALDFEVNEAKIIVDENGKTKDITYRVRKDAEKLIESFMLAANETVAKHMDQKKIPVLYRIHETPNEKKISLFNHFVKSKGYHIGGKDGMTNPYHIQALFDKLKGKENEIIIRKLLLRSMKQAKYTPENKGHYGLGLLYYSHFTSPIRRYPDLLLHRQIKNMLKGNVFEIKEIEKMLEQYEEYGEITSERERRAIDVEREVENMKKTEFISKDVGKIFEGMISSVTKFGFYVELEHTVEGLVHAKTLQDDYYQFDEKNYRLVGKKTKTEHQLGDKVKVKIKNVNIEEGTVELQLITKNKKKFKEHKKMRRLDEEKRGRRW